MRIMRVKHRLHKFVPHKFYRTIITMRTALEHLNKIYQETGFGEFA